MATRTFTPRDYQKMKAENEKIKEELIRYYQMAKNQMLFTLNKIQLGELFTEDFEVTDHYNALIKQIDYILAQLDMKTEEVLKKLIPREYALGQMNASIAFDSAGLILSSTSVGTFSLIDQNAIRAIVYDTFSDLASSNRTMGEFFKRTLRTIAKEEVAKNVITGDPISVQASTLKERLEAEGFKGFVKKNGAKINGDDYAYLVVHSKTMQAHNDGTMLTMVQEGFDLVQISHHKSACKTCQKYEGKIYSISGTHDKYPPISSIPNGGPPFHPHCRHVVKPYIEKFHDGTL